MSEVAEFVKVFQQQLELQRQQMEQQRQEADRRFDMLVAKLTPANGTSAVSSPSMLSAASIPSFTPFDSTSELWKDYWTRFKTFAGANSVPVVKMAQVFLTNQTPALYKLLCTLAAQCTPPKDVNELSLDEIAQFMESQFDPKRFVVRERFKYWSDMQRKASCYL